jgi:hypothetical protein
MKKVSSAYIPSFQLTEGQPTPFAANGGLSYMSFDQDGDAGTAAATEAALQQIATGEGQAFGVLPLLLLQFQLHRLDQTHVGQSSVRSEWSWLPFSKLKRRYIG